MRNKRIWKMTALALSLSVLFGALGVTAVADEPETEPAEEAIELPADLGTAVQENANFALYCDQESCNFAVVDKRSGKVWYGFDPGYADAVSVEETRAQAGSLLKISFYDADMLASVMTSASDAVERDQVNYLEIDGGIRFEIAMGRQQGDSPIPQAISEERMDELILDKLEDDWDRGKVTSFYLLYSKDDMMDEAELDRLCAQYPLLREQNLYIMRDDVEDNEIENMVRIFQSVDYTAEQAKEDNLATGADAQKNSDPYFKLLLDIILTEDGFSASVDMGKLESNEDFKLNQVTFLEYFGAGRHNTAGEMLFPDGSGVMMRYGNDEVITPISEIGSNVYGPNYALSAEEAATVVQPVRMPVYGSRASDGAYIAIIEKGETLARITARASDSVNFFNTVYSTFSVRFADEFKFEDVATAGYTWLAYERDVYTGVLTVRYKLLEKEKNSLADMAKAYRDYLNEIGVIGAPIDKDDIPFYLETLGYYTRKSKFIGIPINKKTPLTTFSEAEEMLDALNGMDVKNIQLRYIGYANGGMLNTVYNKLNPAGCLGGKNGFQSLLQYAAEKGYGFYPDMELSLVAKDKWFDGFSPSRDTVRTLDKKYGGWTETQLSDAQSNKDTFRYALSADKIRGNAQKLVKSLDKLGVKSVSLGSLGETLAANFHKKNSINRQNAQNYIEEVFDSYQEKYDLMTSGGNLYALRSSTHIVNLPNFSSQYNLNGYTVPFVQMAIHGYKQYAGTPINISGNYKEEVLRAVAAGGGIYFVMNRNNTEYLKDSDYSRYYSTRFDDWAEEAAAIYQKANAVLSQVNRLEMTGFELLSDKVSKTIYGGSQAVIVNYSNQDFTYQGTTIGPQDFALVAA